MNYKIVIDIKEEIEIETAIEMKIEMKARNENNK